MIFFLIGILFGTYLGKLFHKYLKLPRLYPINYYSIGIYEGSSPLMLKPSSKIKNPVLTSKNVSDVPAKYIADPFMIKENRQWYMFFEVINNKTGNGEIGLAISDDGYKWHYKQIVLKEPFHLSYPYIFKVNGDFFMIPESMQSNCIRLYKAEEFPTVWIFEKN
jgi:hypothetical protein